MVERDGNGHLKKGSVLNPRGRPRKEREHDYMNIMLSCITRDDWAAIVNRAKEQAIRGDAVARKWLTDYLIGPPVERKELTGADSTPLTIRVIYEDSGKQGDGG